MLRGLGNGSVVSVSDFPVAWKILRVDDKYSGSEYVRCGLAPRLHCNFADDVLSIYWGSTNMVWDLAGWGSKNDGTKVNEYI